MSYAFAPARWVASKNGDFRYHGPKNKVLWPALWGMSAPPENCARNAHRLFEGFLGRRFSWRSRSFRATASHVAAFREARHRAAAGRIRAPVELSRYSRGTSRPRHPGDVRIARRQRSREAGPAMRGTAARESQGSARRSRTLRLAWGVGLQRCMSRQGCLFPLQEGGLA